jgi:hypothetical protein
VGMLDSFVGNALYNVGQAAEFQRKEARLVMPERLLPLYAGRRRSSLTVVLA